MEDYTIDNPLSAIPYGYCHCGCGQETTIPNRSNLKRNRVKGRPMNFVHGHWSRLQPITPVAIRFRQYVPTVSQNECQIWQGQIHQGYGVFHLTKTQRISAHRLAYELVYGPVPEGKIICHHCNNPACVNPQHLYAGTDADNFQDSVIAGTTHITIKLSPKTVRNIRQEHQGGLSITTLAQKYSVSRGNIENVVYRKTWKHVV